MKSGGLLLADNAGWSGERSPRGLGGGKLDADGTAVSVSLRPDGRGCVG